MVSQMCDEITTQPTKSIKAVDITSLRLVHKLRTCRACACPVKIFLVNDQGTGIRLFLVNDQSRKRFTMYFLFRRIFFELKICVVSEGKFQCIFLLWHKFYISTYLFQQIRKKLRIQRKGESVNSSYINSMPRFGVMILIV